MINEYICDIINSDRFFITSITERKIIIMAIEKANKDDQVAKAKSVRAARFRLGPHNTMERFCATFIVFVVALGLIVSSAAYQKVQNSKITLTEQAIYGMGETMFSLTQDVVKIDGLWTNDSHTKAFIMIHMPGGVTNLSAQAEDYQMFMTGVNGEINGTPSGSIYVFGSTGYIGLGFTNSAGFEPAAYKITLRNISYLSEGDQEAAAAAHDGKEGSYMHHNEMNIVANFAASGAQTAEFYAKADYTATDIYNELVQSNLIAAKAAECDEIVATINSNMRKANEYAERIETAGISQEDYLPAAIYVDSVTITEPLDTPKMFIDGSMLYMTSGKLDSASGFYACVDTNNTEQFPDGSKLYYQTGYVFPGGLNYNWQNLTAHTDLLSEIVPPDMSYPQFVEYLNQQQTTFTVDTSAKFGNYIDTRNGTIFKKDATGALDLVSEDAKTNISNYEGVISEIFSKKRDLQTVKLRELAGLYYSSSAINDITSVYMNDDALVLY